MPSTFATKTDYCNNLLKLVKLESYIESLREQVFYEASYVFDMNEQREITKRIVLHFSRSNHKFTDQAILALRMPYRREAII